MEYLLRSSFISRSDVLSFPVYRFYAYVSSFIPRYLGFDLPSKWYYFVIVKQNLLIFYGE